MFAIRANLSNDNSHRPCSVYSSYIVIFLKIRLNEGVRNTTYKEFDLLKIEAVALIRI